MKTIKNTLKGLKSTAIEKWNTLGKEGVRDIRSLQFMYDDMIQFWEIYDAPDFFEDLPFNAETLYILENIEAKGVAVIEELGVECINVKDAIQDIRDQVNLSTEEYDNTTEYIFTAI